MLLIQYGLGISVNLYSTLPASDHAKPLFAGFTSAVGDGPVLLSLHALLGTLLLITASAALVRAVRLAATAPIALTAAALLAIIVAWLAGSAFVGQMKNDTSLTMALGTAVAIFCYALVIFLVRRSPPSRSSAGEQLEGA
jgi:glycerol-3-phosphate acyltransferase PlsY